MTLTPVFRLGGLRSAKLLLWNVEFAEIARLQHADDWDAAGRILTDAARRLEHTGAEGLLICANTTHRMAPAAEAAVSVPVLHLADITARALLANGHRSAALVGARFTMAQPFYHERLERHGLSISVPTPEEQDALHQIIFDEPVKGRVEAASRERIITIMRRMHRVRHAAARRGRARHPARRHHRTPLPGRRRLDARVRFR